MNNLFSEIDSSFSQRKGVIFCDGGSRGNPGISAGGSVLYDENKKEIARDGIFTGSNQTNNFAEYSSLIIGMKLSLTHNITHLEVFMDSKLAIEQMKGKWKVKHINIKPLFEKAKYLEESFEKVSFYHIPREKNKIADEIANEVMDKNS